MKLLQNNFLFASQLTSVLLVASKVILPKTAPAKVSLLVINVVALVTFLATAQVRKMKMTGIPMWSVIGVTKRGTLPAIALNHQAVVHLVCSVISVGREAILLVIVPQVRMCVINVTKKATLLVIAQTRRMMLEYVTHVVRVVILLVNALTEETVEKIANVTTVGSRVILPGNAQKLAQSDVESSTFWQLV